MRVYTVGLFNLFIIILLIFETKVVLSENSALPIVFLLALVKKLKM